MARKPTKAKAKAKAKELDASPDAIDADAKTLIDSLMLVSVLSEAIERIYDDLWKQKQSCGMPKANEWPNSPEFEHRRAQYDDWVKEQQAKFALNGESWSPCEFQEFPWTKLIREWSACYQTWCAAMATAKQAAIIYLGKLRPARKWTTKTIVNLDNLADTLHPSGTGGVDGLGFIRCGLPPLPTAFHACVAAVRKRIPKLRAISVLAVATPEVQGINSATSPTVDWVVVQGQLLSMRAKNKPFTSQRDLANQFKCSQSTIAKVIASTEMLKGWAARRRTPKAVGLTAKVLDNAEQTTEAAPTARVEQHEETLAELIQQQNRDDKSDNPTEPMFRTHKKV